MIGAELARSLLTRGDELTVLQRRPSGLPCREVLGWEPAISLDEGLQRLAGASRD